MSSTGLTPSWRWLRWANAALYIVERFVNDKYSERIAPMSRQHETLITPAGYAFSIWGIIYPLLTLAVVVDCFCPVLSLFSYVDHPKRLWFTVVCLGNMAWSVWFPTGALNLATLALSAQWLALAALFLLIVTTRRECGFSVGRFICSELAFTMYFAWTSAAALISIAVSMQEATGDYLSLWSYLSMVTLLAVLTISILMFTGDVVFGGVAIWALVGVAIKDVPDLDDATQQTSWGIRASATQSAAIISVFILIAITRAGVDRIIPKRELPAIPDPNLPLINDKTLSVDYGSSTA